jgi:hypothetical protein
MTTETLRLLLLLFLFASYALAVFYLSRRSLTRLQFATWALVALLIPLLGPFIVFVTHPGQRRSRTETLNPRQRRLDR